MSENIDGCTFLGEIIKAKTMSTGAYRIEIDIYQNQVENFVKLVKFPYFQKPCQFAVVPIEDEFTQSK